MESYNGKRRNVLAISALSLVALVGCGNEKEQDVVTKEVNSGAIHDEVKTLYPEADNIRITEGDQYGTGGAVLWDMPDSRTCSAFVIRNAHKAYEGNVLAAEPYCRETVSR